MNPSSLVNHSWKPCTYCGGDGLVGLVGFNDEKPNTCPHCQGHGVEPVAVENPYEKLSCGECNGMGCLYDEFDRKKTYPCKTCKGKMMEKHYKHQVGVEFEVNINIPVHPIFFDGKLKFLPLYQKVSGDNSILMVTKL